MRDCMDLIGRVLSSPAYGVVGASTHRERYGNKVLRCYQQNGRRAIPVNPHEPVVGGTVASRDSASQRDQT